jgi:hypothetical protein
MQPPDSAKADASWAGRSRFARFVLDTGRLVLSVWGILALVGFGLMVLLARTGLLDGSQTIEWFDRELLLCVVAGLIAQVIDGALGMAYGVSATTVLLFLGIPPAGASAAVHISEIVTCGASGISHAVLGNIRRDLLWKLVFPGALGAAFGAYVLTDLVSGERIKPFITIYLACMGLLLAYRALQTLRPPSEPRSLTLLALFGGTMDAVGGGGWGPIVTSTLLNRGTAPRYAIGSVNTAEFFVAFASSVVFIVSGEILYVKYIIGLIIGGTFAAPFAALVVRSVPRRTAMLVVAALVIILSGLNLYKMLA